ncbi:hypothetical protein [Aeromonas phage 4L372XY]|uniref:Uncharacterized protein n=1 Tax=Aeromonas phage 4L372XY TaxID=2588520 RepID=A0A5B9N3J2_9CAUD|nr:hypothetical protein HWC28_gp002 [Aeromonas phage 4L372XY]QEG08717.1 hypothetical protein [Aeromonas phage 4L372XY]
MSNRLYYKMVCIDEQHAIIAEQQLNNAETGKLKAKRLGRAVIVSINNSDSSTEPLRGSIDKEGLEQNELAEINYLVSSVRVHAMAYDDELSQYDIDVIEAVSGLGT